MTHKNHTRPVAELPERLPPAQLSALSRDEFYSRYPAKRFVAQLEQQRTTAPNLLPAWLGGAALAGAVALVIVLAGPGVISEDALTPPPRNPVRTRVFGAAGSMTDKSAVPQTHVGTTSALPAELRFQLYNGRDFDPIDDGARLHAGDILRFYYDSGASDFLYLFSVDDAGVITTYYPEEKYRSIPIVRGRNIPLPDGVRLDSYVGHERFFALFSDQPVDFVEIEVAVRSSLLPLQAAGRGIRELNNLPLDCRQVTLWIEKR